MNATSIDRLGEAMALNREARIVYRDAKGVRTIRGVRLTAITESGLIKVECSKRKAARSLRVERIEHVFPARPKRASRPAPTPPSDPFEGLDDRIPF